MPSAAKRALPGSGVLPPKTMFATCGAVSSFAIRSKLPKAQRSLDECRVRAGLDEGRGPGERGVEPFDRPRIGARHDLKVRVGARIHGRLDLVQHLVERDDGLAREVPAAFREDLVLDLEAGGAPPVPEGGRYGSC